MRELVFINTLGLTGSEFVAAALRETAGLRVLPGQNFIQQGHALYRPHAYAGRSAAEVFAELNREQVMRSGRIWMGLTKHMSPAERAGYDRPAHAREFCARLGEARDYRHCVMVYAETFFLTAGKELEESEGVAVCGGNFALNFAAEPGFAAQTRVVDVTNGIYTWLAMISQRMTFDGMAAAQFWLVNRLWLARFSRRNPRVLSVALEDYHRDPAAVTAKLHQQLGRNVRTKSFPQPGFKDYNPAIMEGVMEDAAGLHRIYHGLPLFELAENFEGYAAELLARPGMDRLLDRYQAYWNTTGHTNFDVIGPIEQEIISGLERETIPPAGFTSAWFYHRAYRLDSDHYNAPAAHWCHPLGGLEDEIELPLLPFYLKIAIHYLRSLIESYQVFLHSYIPMRQQALYRRLQDPRARKKAVECGFAPWLDELESKIDAIEVQVNKGGSFNL